MKGDIINFYDYWNEDYDLTVAEWIKKHPDEYEKTIMETEDYIDQVAEEERHNPGFSAAVILKDVKTRQEHIGDKPYEEMTTFERKIMEKNDEELRKVAEYLAHSMSFWGKDK